VEQRASVSGKTSLTRLSLDEAVEALGVEVDVLRERIRDNTISHERDEHGRVYVLVGASSNVPNPDHNRHRTPRDEALIEDLEAQALDLRATADPTEGSEEPTKASQSTRNRCSGRLP
jgi:hypothetical protein